MASPSYGFPRTRRLSTAADFQRVFEQPCKSADQYLTVLARTNGRDYPRLGLAIARRQIRNAADRNRIKRLIRESFRLQQSLLGGVDFVVMARSAAIQADHDTIRSSLHKHWENLVRRCKPSWSSSSNSIST
ncbi:MULTISPECIES: ribonuclease P protein component [Methylocaldum]|uniref:ribonuclease P protein component n=1 Tax=unclassified Methylocaldum TaxID=2622260 RepID=UPI00098BBA17|nr:MULTISPECIES: ribonuclease P protein component [unclassified Methylocaldum]MDV3240348.1 ribonuclease P protein component [Methylocaldum sp.]MVF21478.1 ribonuclease P protein component [Methylocaldum sp. BRCS4]